MGNEQSIEGPEIVINEKQIAKLPYNVPDLGEVKKMDLSRNLFKELPKDVPKLLSLAMEYNELSEDSSDIVDSISQYKKLLLLNLSNNLFTIFPESFHNLMALRKLELNNNKIMEFNMCYPKLEYLDLSQNQLRTLPPIPGTLSELHISFNFFDKLELMHSNLNVLKASLCDIREIGHFSLNALTELDLSRNKLKSFPDFVKCTPNLKCLNLSDNFCEQIPPLPASMQRFFFSGNNCTSIPVQCSILNKLKFFDISNNKIKVLKNLPSSLEYIVCVHNEIDTIDLPKMDCLVYFIGHNNKLTRFPAVKFPRIRKFNVSCNSIESFEAEFPTVENFFVEFNKLKEIPQWIFTCKNIKHVNFNANQITKIPSSFSKGKFSHFSVAFNQLEGPIPPISKHLEDLSCAFCNLTELPSGGENLKVLIAGNNKITKVPFYPKLQELHLPTNRLTEFPAIPDTVFSIDVSRNKISKLPVGKLTKVRELDVMYNMIDSIEQIPLPLLFMMKIGHNPLKYVFDHKLYPNLDFLDVMSTDITFKSKDPPINHIHVSKNRLKTPHCMMNQTYDWLCLSEMRGTRKVTEDMFICKANQADKMAVMAIFDGHAGPKTAAYACISFASMISSQNMQFSVKWLKNACREISDAVKTKAFSDGSTLAIALTRERSLYTASIGDSRIFVFNESGEMRYQNKVYKSTDRDEFERIHEAGGSVYGFRLQNSVAVSRTLGDMAVPGICHDAECDEVHLAEDDRWIILGCDGVFDELPIEFIGELCRKAKSAIGLAYTLRSAAFAGRSKDNITVIVQDMKSLYNKVANGPISHIADLESTMR